MPSRRSYMGGVFNSTSLGLSHMMLAAVVMIVLFYGLKHNDNHSILCTFGAQFVSGIAILSTEVWFGDRGRNTHISLHIIGLLLTIFGIAVVEKEIKMPNNDHGRAGYVGVACTLINAVTGPLSYCVGNWWWWVHVLIGVIAFVSSSVSLVLALYMSVFKSWAGDTFVTVLVVFVVLYTLDITLSCLSRLF